MGVPCFWEVSQISCQLEHRNPNPPMGIDHRHVTPPFQSFITMESMVSDIKITALLGKQKLSWVFNVQNLHMGCRRSPRRSCEEKEEKGRKRSITAFHQCSHTGNQRVISEVISNDVNHAPKFQAMMTLPQQQLHNKHLLALCLHAYHSPLRPTRREKLVIMQNTVFNVKLLQSS